MIIGSPAKAVRELTAEQIEGLRRSALGYQANAKRFRSGLKRVDAGDAPGRADAS
jgi:carbonic anhydrase/acetyltransferase-like protein (isoleucine patch superfamily)